MKFATFQAIILLKDHIETKKQKKIIADIKNFIKKYTNKINMINQHTRPLAYEIEGYENAKFIAIEFTLNLIGSKKRIKMVEAKLNTIDEILNFKILEKNIKMPEEINTNEIHIVYEFDFGDIEHGIEPRCTIFGGFTSRERAEIEANLLLKEGLDNYFLDSMLKNEENPFKNNDEVHLYKDKNEEEQGESVYYIKIEKINIE